ncbi:peptide methionine sulfoxide reductase MsrA [Polymorphobacter multimanifer]|uniref:Peptide methionine sulfoxide reductase MsrA n=1 Tax=Polymorphobacter multimanifer TaxID=1070431 RepID=A0A841L881_9SPHN|nr:peptide-methionine (S)-S-oxide reductase MsrA [Polymorphobacter multimanifer]MBB6226065.1 peptide-methionine (S)-S-oxide reductase [Polymorphobacter multimanifer]GGI83934.1 peptide methionine sulfoxide reductase MsrA [Polymorphobacter multimanifer]
MRIALASLLLATAACSSAIGAERMVLAPAPAQDEALKAGPLKTAVFAGGCFWGVEGVFERVKGVQSVRSGYAGGARATASYTLIGSGLTGHAEAVEIRYDPAKVSYGTLLRVFYSVAHNPTQLNYQGPDRGSQYRSAIFPQSPEQEKLARAYVAQLEKAGTWGKIVTTFEAKKPFYLAEDHHQDYLRANPTQPYIAINDIPKVEGLKRMFPALWSDRPAV